MAIGLSFDLTPKEAYEYLDGKGYKLSYNYDELEGMAHHKSFTVAKVTRADLLQDIHQALLAAQKTGTPFSEFLRQLKPTLEKKGWWGKREIVDPKTGEIKTVHINSRRLENIFKTNMRVSYNVGRYKKQRESSREYWRYVSMRLPTSREEHSALHGTILHCDNPFWQTNYPPNGWGCKCKVTAYSKRQIEKRGMKVSESAPNVASKDWNHDIGAGSRVAKISKLDLDAASLHALTPKPELDDLSDAELKERFYQRLGVVEGEMLLDKINDPMIIDDDLFKAASGHSKIKKRNRHLYLNELAQVIAEPDEIYLDIDELKSGKSRIVKKMFRYFTDNKGKRKAVIAVFEYSKDKTQGVSLYVIESEKAVNRKRTERLIYAK